MTSALLISSVIGIFFNAYISQKIGAEGMGIYGLVMTVYIFCATFSTSGITLAVTRSVTDFLTLGRESEAKKAVEISAAAGIVISGITAAALFIFSEEIGNGFLKDGRTVLSIKVLSLSLPFMSVSACFRGYFLAVRKVIRSSGEQLFEQLVKIIICINIIPSFCERGLEYACCAAAIGTAGSEAASCVYSAVLYFTDVGRYRLKRKKSASVVRKLVSVGLPVTGSSCLRSGLSMFENTLIPSGLRRFGMSSERSLSEYGIITGMALPILSFPYVFLSAFSMLIIPEMSEALAEKNGKRISRMAKKVLTATFFFVVPVTAFFFVFADRLGELLYGRSDVGFYVRILAMTVPFSYLDHVVDGMLKGLDQQLHYFAYNIIDSTVRVILAVFLIPRFGIKAIIVIMFVSAILNSTLSTYRLIKVTIFK